MEENGVAVSSVKKAPLQNSLAMEQFVLTAGGDFDYTVVSRKGIQYYSAAAF